MRRIVAQPSLLPLYIIVEQKRKSNAKKYNTTRAARLEEPTLAPFLKEGEDGRDIGYVV